MEGHEYVTANYPELKEVRILGNDLFVEIDTHKTSVYTSAESKEVFTGRARVLLVGEECTFKDKIQVGDWIKYRPTVDLNPYIPVSETKFSPNERCALFTFKESWLGVRGNKPTAIISEYDVLAIVPGPSEGLQSGDTVHNISELRDLAGLAQAPS